MPAGSTMAKILSRGRLIVGVDQNTYLFGFRNPATGEIEGFDIDIAREVAKAIFGDRRRARPAGRDHVGPADPVPDQTARSTWWPTP